MTATITPFPSRSPDPVTAAALTELIQLGLHVARLASRLAQAEDQALDALAEATTAAARTAATASSLAAATEAGNRLDRTDAERTAIAARVASITESFDKAARAIRRTATLQARLADPRPFNPAGWASTHRNQAQPAGRPTRPASEVERTERPDRPDWDDELGNRTDDEVLQAIRRDLADALSPPPLSPPPLSLPPLSLPPRATQAGHPARHPAKRAP